MSTARGVALLRAIETTRPEAERITADPFARAFVNPFALWSTALLRSVGILDVTLPGGMVDFVLARDRYVHDLMIREARAGLGQLVVLGAGFDTRPYRTAELASTPVFEVDHPATQRAKRAALAGVVEPPSNVTFVGVDFDRDDLDARLRTAGYDPRSRTLFVWQGVTMYLTAEGVDATLAFIARHSPPGSIVVFDYFFRDILTSRRSAFVRLMTRMMGERVTFGIDAAGIVPFLEARGFGSVEVVDGARLRELYWRGPEARRPMEPGGAIAVARVAG